MAEKVPKRIAKDGTQRGLQRKGSKNKATLLLESMKEDAKVLFGIQGFDPVRQMNLIGLMAYNGYPATDDQGNPILDEYGKQVMVPPDHGLALAAFAKVSPYVQSQLRPKDAQDEDQGDDPERDKEEMVAALKALGANTTLLERKKDGSDDG